MAIVSFDCPTPKTKNLQRQLMHVTSAKCPDVLVLCNIVFPVSHTQALVPTLMSRDASVLRTTCHCWLSDTSTLKLLAVASLQSSSKHRFAQRQSSTYQKKHVQAFSWYIYLCNTIQGLEVYIITIWYIKKTFRIARFVWLLCRIPSVRGR